MATIEKVKKKKAKSAAPVPRDDVAPDQDSKTGSVISVSEAQENDKADTIQKNNESRSGSQTNLVEENTELRPSSAVQRPPSASNQRPSSAVPSHRPTSATSERLPPKKNAVIPMESDNKSIVSNKSKEAWVEQSERPGTSSSTTRPFSSVSKNSVRPLTEQEIGPGDSVSQVIAMRELSSSSRLNSANTTKTFQTTPMSKRPDSRVSNQLSEKETNAYVPYVYARDSVAKVVEDMKKMKNNHIRIVYEIENTYRSIEDETQAQFNAFVLSLRGQYSNKVKTFRQVIELHRLELNQKQQYWDEALASFGGRNQKLLRDKKTLLIQNKLEYERLEREKAEALESLTQQLDESNIALAAANKDKEDLEEEVNVLGDDNQRLRRELEALCNRPELEGVVFVDPTEPEKKKEKRQEDKMSVKEEEDTLAAGIVTVTPMSEKDTKEIERLKQELEAKDKKNKMLEKDLKKLLKSQAKIQKQNESERVKRLLEVLVAEVRSIHGDVEMATLLTEDRLNEVKEDNVGVGDDLKSVKEEYDVWVQEFSEEHGWQPTAADRNSDPEGKILHEKYTDATKKYEDSDLRLTALTMISTGAVPERLQPKPEPTTHVAAAAVVTSDNAGNRELKDKIEELEEEITELKASNEDLEETNREQEEKIADLERQLEEAQQDTREGGVGLAVAASSAEDVEDLSAQISALQKQIDETEADLRDEKAAHDMSREELEAMKAQLVVMTTDLENQKAESEVKLEAETARLHTEIDNLQAKLDDSEKKIEALEEARLANVPVDTKQEINDLSLKIIAVTKEKDTVIKDKALLESKLKELQSKLNSQEKSAINQKAASSDTEQKLKGLKTEKDRELKEQQKQFEKKEKERAKQEEKKIAALEKKIRDLEVAVAAASRTRATSARPKTAAGGDAKTKDLQEKLREANKENKDLTNRNKQLEKELRAAEKSGGGGMDEKQKKKHEKVLLEMEKRLDAALKKVEKQDKQIHEKDESLQSANKDIKDKTAEIARLSAELSALGVAAKEGIEAAEKVKTLEKEVKSLTKENKQLAENFNSERVLRKKYYNMVEDMKGKIRVYCRARPMSKSELDRGNYSCIKSPDEYTISISGSRGLKEFQFDTIFMPESTQEKVFEDTNNLIQSAVDGYNVCIFAYGQTGSGKTFTIIGDKDQKFPGIAPRAFERIFELADENKAKFKFKVEVYMMELYNDRLIDLFGKDHSGEEKVEIKKDKKGMVFVQGAEIKPARNAKELMGLFEEGSKNRHTAATKMNADSSRSHLVIGITIESTNKTSGQVLKGKLSLVDLAGSERAAKTGAGAEQLKEAMSINKSLSALGDVISALSSEQSFIPYRNNKLTMLMQDSLGGNAKTLMFVNISPADYNNEESTISLAYASRVKLITNDASKNADNKEISRLKGIIAKLKKGDTVAEEELE